MKHYLLNKNNVGPLCIDASGEWQVYLPLQNPGGDVCFTKLDNKNAGLALEKLQLDYEYLVNPPKTVTFPQLESLFKFEHGSITETANPAVKKLLFGLRACDVKAMLFLDDFFARNFRDIYYFNRSADKLTVIVGCTHPLENCFCTSAKTGPFLPLPESCGPAKYAEFDLQLVDVGDKYVVEVGSAKGEQFISSYSKFFEEAAAGDLNCAKKAKRDAEEAVTLKLDFEAAVKKFCQNKVPQQMYETIADRCIYCGGCLYVCPTCSCFNTFDDQNAGRGARYRNWDACVFEGYTREASGHNPRPEKWVRTSRRYEHKLKYDYLTTQMSGCVGCGRCLSSCPVNIGISQVIEKVAIN